MNKSNRRLFLKPGRVAVLLFAVMSVMAYPGPIFSTHGSKLEAQIIDAAANNNALLPLSLYIRQDQLSDMRKWYSSGTGEAKRFDWNNPEKYAEPLLKAVSSPWNNTDEMPPGTWHVTECAFAYALTGNENCGKAVKSMLLKLAAMPGWKRHPSAPFLESHIVMVTVISYDFIYPLLNTEDRRIIVHAVENKGLKPIRDYLMKDGNWLSRSGRGKGYPGYLQYSNQAASFLGAMYLGSRLLYQETGQKQYCVDYTNSALDTRVLINNYFPEDGSVTAATGYYLRTLEELSYVIIPMAGTLGMEIEAFLPQGARNPFIFAQYLFSNAGPKDVDAKKYPYLLAFGDSSFDSLVYDPVQKHQISNRYCALALWSAVVKDPQVLWMYNTYVKNTGQRFNESALSLASHYLRYRNNREMEPSEPVLDKEKIFRNSGLYIWRDGFSRGDKLFALWKRVYQRGDHLHNDQNTFLFEAYGERYFTDLGIDYATDAERGYTRSYNSNSITVGMQDSGDGFNRREIFPYLTTGSMNYARSDSSYVDGKDKNVPELRGYTSRNAELAVRSVVYMKPYYYAVIDSVRNTEPATVENNFVSSCPFRSHDGFIEYIGQGSALYQSMVSSERSTMKKNELADDHGKKVYRLSWETGGKVKQVDMINVLYPSDEGQAPLFRKDINDSCVMIEITKGNMKDIIIKKKQSAGQAAIAEYATDCETCVLRFRDGGLYAVGFFQGTRLMHKGRAIISSRSPVSLICEPHQGTVSGKANTKQEVAVTFSLGEKPVTLMMLPTDLFGNCCF